MVDNIAAYHFAPIDAPQLLADRVHAWAVAHDLRGTVLVAPEGLNLVLAGDAGNVGEFLAHLRGDARFTGLLVKHSASTHVPFARLKVRVKREIIRFDRDEASPLQRRAPKVSPEALARWIEQGRDDAGRRLVLLDTRNREEVGYGTFRGAITLPIDNFTGLPVAVEAIRGQLADATVVSFCTGGIRCEKSALWMQDAGFEHTHQLDGGILNYFERVGGLGYDGACFVFDGRIALDPQLRPMVDAPATVP